MRRANPIRRRCPCSSEEGFILIAVIFLLALFILALGAAAPNIARQIQRDRDLETWHRGMQYRRAIRMYYKKFGNYPTSVDQLVNTNQIRFLRKRYKDPITGKDDWKPIHFGQNKVATALGFFGVPLAGSTMGIMGCNANGLNASNMTSGSNSGLSDSTFGSSNSSFGSSNSSFGSSGSSFGSSDTSSSTGGSGCGSTDSSTNGNNNDSSNTNGNSNNPNGTQGNSNGSSGTNDTSSNTTNSSDDTSSTSAFNTPGSSGTGSAFGGGGQTIGGGGIIGFSPASPKKSILLYKKKDHYNQWEFVYDPASELTQGGAAGMNGQAPGATGLGTSTGIGGTGIGGTGIGGTGIGGTGIGGTGIGGSSTSGSDSGSGTSSGSDNSNSDTNSGSSQPTSPSQPQQ